MEMAEPAAFLSWGGVPCGYKEGTKEGREVVAVGRGDHAEGGSAPRHCESGGDEGKGLAVDFHALSLGESGRRVTLGGEDFTETRIDMAAPASNAPFPNTKWSLVLGSGRGSPAGEAALAELCQAYWLPLYTFARRSGHAPADAEDLVQGFLSKAVVDELFSRADVERGRLRTFLLTAFRRYSKDVRAMANAGKRGGGLVVSLDGIEAEQWYAAGASDAGTSPEEAYDRQWALTLLERACDRLSRDFAERGKGAVFEALRPFLTTPANASDYASVGSRLGMKPDTVKVSVHRLRSRFGALLREEVRETHADDGDVDAELRHLIQLL